MQLTARVDDSSRWAWTVLALAVRIAHALGLQRESTSRSIRPFEAEMRRRLWHALCIIDTHASADRGSDPIILGSEYSTRLPANINDADMSPESIYPPVTREGITEMSFCLMMQSSSQYFWRLFYLPQGDLERPPLPIECDWDMRQRQIEVWCQHLEEHYLRYCDESVPLHWFMKRLGEDFGNVGRLIAIRPMRRHPAAKPPHVDSSVILSLSTELLEGSRRIYEEPAIRQWGWYTWVQWHPLAVALSELCSQTEGPLVERAWRAVEYIYARCVDLVADTKRGMLWRPVEKLYKKAKANRAAKLKTSETATLKKDSAIAQPFNMQTIPLAGTTAPYVSAQQIAERDHTSGLQQLSVSDTMQPLNPEMFEPVDMAWLDWATFADNLTGFDMTDFGMADPVTYMDLPIQQP